MTLRATQNYVEITELGESKIRATQNYVEVAEIGDSNIRATQLYIEVLQHVEISYEESVSDPLGITDSVLATGDWNRSASDDLGLYQQVDRFRLYVSDTMTLFSGLVEFLAVDDFKPIAHSLGLTQAVISGSDRTVVDPMSLTHEVIFAGPRAFSIGNPLGIHDSVSYCNGAPWETIEIEHIISFVQAARKGVPLSVANTLALTDEAARVDSTSHFVSFVQTVSAGIGKFVFNILEMNHQLNSESIYGRTLTHDDLLQDAMAYYVITPCSTKQYNRFEGSGPESGIPEAPLTFDANFVLETLSGNKVKLQMRNPETDDKQRIGFSRVNRETSGGELNVYSDPAWPKVKNLLFTIVAISDGKGNCPDKLTDLMDFLQTNLGLEVLIHDWEGISWRGVITTPNEVATEDRDGWWTFSFEFSGEDLDGSQGDQNLAISDTVFLNADWGRTASHAMTLEQTIVVSGILQHNITDPLGITDTVVAEIDNIILSDNFSGSSGTDLHGQSPDVGGSSWSAHTDYKADGSQTAINSGAYYPFAPQHWTNYEITWKPRTMTHGDGLASWFFLGEGLNSNPDTTGTTAWGRFDPTTLKSGFGIRRVSGTQLNTCRMGDDTDGLADNVDMTDATLKAMTVDIDLMVDLDTSGGANTWTVTWYAKDPVDSDWTEVRAATKLLSEDITMVGWSNDNTTTVVDMSLIEIKEKVSL